MVRTKPGELSFSASLCVRLIWLDWRDSEGDEGGLKGAATGRSLVPEGGGVVVSVKRGARSRLDSSRNICRPSSAGYPLCFRFASLYWLCSVADVSGSLSFMMLAAAGLTMAEPPRQEHSTTVVYQSGRGKQPARIHSASFFLGVSLCFHSPDTRKETDARCNLISSRNATNHHHHTTHSPELQPLTWTGP